MPRRGSELAGTLLVALSGATFGLLPFFAVWGGRLGLSIFTMLTWRFLGSALVLVVLAVLAGQARRYPARPVVVVVLMGAVMYTLQSSLYFVAVSRVAPALAVLILYLHPAMVAGVSAVLDRTPPSPRLVAALVLSFGGVGLAVGRPDGALDPWGLLAALGAAVTYTTYIVCGDRIGSRLPPLASSATVTGSAALAFGVLGTLSGTLDLTPPTPAWPHLFGLAIVCGAIPISTFLAGVPLVGAARASILSTLEPALGVVGTALLLGVSLGVGQWVGVAFVLVGAVLSALAHRRTDEEVTAEVPI